MLLRSCKKKSINLANSRKINVKLRACLILLALLPSFFFSFFRFDHMFFVGS
jgi:hypothetical protein